MLFALPIRVASGLVIWYVVRFRLHAYFAVVDSLTIHPVHATNVQQVAYSIGRELLHNKPDLANAWRFCIGAAWRTPVEEFTPDTLCRVFLNTF